MQGQPSGFSQGHTNWFAIGGPAFGFGMAGALGLVITVATQPTAAAASALLTSSLFRICLGATSAFALLGAYTMIAPFAGWPLPEPNPSSRSYWRRGTICAVLGLGLTIASLFFMLPTIVWVISATLLGVLYLTAPTLRSRPEEIPSTDITETENFKLLRQIEALKAERDARDLAEAIAPRDLMAEAVWEARLSGVEHARDQLQQRLDAMTNTVRGAAFQLAKEIREKVDSVAASFSLDEQCALIFDDFNERFLERYHKIVERIHVMLPGTPLAEDVLPTTRDNLRRIADTLESVAQHVPEDMPL